KDPNNGRALISALDKAAKRGIIHRNAAKRRKARLNKARTTISAPTA
ncbi:MAG: 30S ribosomal protein S20, partial [Gemmatimonadaceae bacterium]|nr:30S ribosomal protein S20 [Gemmatimonadaceae bacterium]